MLINLLLHKKNVLILYLNTFKYLEVKEHHVTIYSQTFRKNNACVYVCI